MKMMKYSVLLGLLIMFAGCSGAPSGAFPKQAGSFTLVSGPGLAAVGDTSSGTYYGEYLEGGDKLSSQEIAEQSRMAKTVLYNVTPYPSSDEAQKAFTEYKEDKQLSLIPSNGDSIKESGNKLFLNHRGGMETIVWVKESNLHNASSRVPGAAEKFVGSLPNK